MDEVHSCTGSRLGSNQSLNESFDTKPQQILSMHSIHASTGKLEKQHLVSSSTNSLNKIQEGNIIEPTAAGSLSPNRMTSRMSMHSLYPMCEIKQSPSYLSIKSGINERTVSTPCVPLASLTKELSLSELSIHSNKSSVHPSPESRRWR